jgi:hypothetical protein
MSFSRSGGTAPAFSFPIGVGTFIDVNASNTVFTSNVYSSFYHGDGGLLSNISVSGNIVSNLNASNLAFGIMNTALIYGNTLSNIQFSNIVGLLPNTISNLNASNLGFGFVSSSLIYGNLISNINSSNITQPFTNLVISNALQTTNVICTAVNPITPISFRNRVINGDFLIDQRNAGSNSTPSVDGKSPIDRWKINLNGSGRCLVGQNLGAIVSPTGFTSYFGMKVSTTTSVGSGDYFFLSQVIEGVNTVDWLFGTAGAKTVTLSFWVYSSLTGTMGGFVRNSGTTAGNYSRSYPFTFSVSSTNTWEYKTITIPGDTTGQWITGQTDGLEFGIELWNGSTYQASPGAWAAGNYTGPSGGTANFAGTLNSYMYLSGFQFEIGSSATLYERTLIDFQLAACQRYYEPTIVRVGGYNTSGAFLRGSAYFNTKKRPASNPTFTVISTLESSNVGSLSFDNSNYDQSSARFLVPTTATGDAYGQWKVSVDAEF